MDKKTVAVNCDIPNGIALRRFTMREGPLGIMEAVLAGSVTLKRGHNPGIDAEFWDAWLAQNADNSIVAGNFVTVVKEGDS